MRYPIAIEPDDNAERVPVVAGFNRNGVAHVHDFLF